MKKFIFGFVLGGIIFSIVGVVALNITAGSISFSPTDSNWDVETVDEALNDLYNEAMSRNRLVTSGASIDSGEVINVDVNSIIIVTSVAGTHATNTETVIANVKGGISTGVASWTSIFKATGTSVTLTADNDNKLSYIVLN